MHLLLFFFLCVATLLLFRVLFVYEELFFIYFILFLLFAAYSIPLLLSAHLFLRVLFIGCLPSFVCLFF